MTVNAPNHELEKEAKASSIESDLPDEWKPRVAIVYRDKKEPSKPMMTKQPSPWDDVTIEGLIQ